MNAMTEPRTIAYVPLDDVSAAARNPKTHDLDGIRASIGRFGLVAPAVVDERTGRLVAGHGRLSALRAMRDAGQDAPAGVQLSPDGDWLVPMLTGWASRSDAEADAYLIADNQWTVRGGWDEPDLGAFLAALGSADPDLMAATGFTDADAAAMLRAATVPDFEPDPNGEGSRLDQRKPLTCPSCGYTWRIDADGLPEEA